MPPRLLALRSAVPRHVLDQRDVTRRAERLFADRGDVERLLPVFANTGIATRYSCVPIDWYETEHGWAERNRLYVENASDLIEGVARRLLDDAGLAPGDIDAVVVASTTGLATPSLDALLIERMGLSPTVRRLPIFGLGCAGGVIGLARAADLATAMPGTRVLFVVVELCALTFRRNDLSKSNFVAAALFGDGAAGAILSTEGDGPALVASGEYTWPHSLDVMGWDVENDGLKAVFAQSIPALVSEDFRRVLNGFLARNAVRAGSIDDFACHPGGARVLDALEDALELERGGLEASRAVLRDFGNMSSATVLFVLERMTLPGRRILLTALGPGFTAAFQLLDGTCAR